MKRWIIAMQVTVEAETEYEATEMAVNAKEFVFAHVLDAQADILDVSSLPESWRQAWTENQVVLFRQDAVGRIGWVVRFSGCDWCTDGAAIFRLPAPAERAQDVGNPPFDFASVVPCKIRRGDRRSTYGSARFEVNNDYIDLAEVTFPGGRWGKAPAGFGKAEFNGADALVWTVGDTVMAAVMPIDTVMEKRARVASPRRKRASIGVEEKS